MVSTVAISRYDDHHGSAAFGTRPKGAREAMSRSIVESGLVRKLEVPDPHLYFQAPGGQCLRLVGIDEGMSFYEGAGAGPKVPKVKEALKRMENMRSN
jgi:hypothetical protein